jgi:hypothetical protein
MARSCNQKTRYKGRVTILCRVAPSERRVCVQSALHLCEKTHLLGAQIERFFQRMKGAHNPESRNARQILIQLPSFEICQALLVLVVMARARGIETAR